MIAVDQNRIISTSDGKVVRRFDNEGCVWEAQVVTIHCGDNGMCNIEIGNIIKKYPRSKSIQLDVVRT